MSLFVSILIYTVLGSLATFFVTYFTLFTDKKKITVNAVILMIFTIVLASYNYDLGVQTQKEEDDIRDSVNQNNVLTRLDADIDSKTQLLVRQNDSLTDSVHKLLQKVDAITSSTKKETSEEIAENALTGKLDFHLKKKLRDDEEVALVYGTVVMGQSVKNLKSKNPPRFFRIGDADYGTARIVNNRLLLTMKVYDFYGNWILDIQDNNWVRNKNNTGAFNYNDTSFEVLDNFGNIALNVDFRNNNVIYIQGYILTTDGLLAIGDGIENIPRAQIKTKSDISALLIRAGVKQIFFHTGDNWLHKRKRLTE